MKVYVIGDSISMHYGPFLQAFLKGFMDYARKDEKETAALKLVPQQDANGGDSSAVLAFLKAKAIRGGIDADILLLNCGLHDIKTDPVTGAKQVPIEQYKTNLKAILETAAGMRPRPVWIRSTPCDESVHNRPGAAFHRFKADVLAYNGVADKIMKETGVPVIDLHTFTLNLGGDLYCDHVHFHEHIREKQGAFIAGWLIAFAARGFARK